MNTEEQRDAIRLTSLNSDIQYLEAKIKLMKEERKEVMKRIWKRFQVFNEFAKKEMVKNEKTK